MPQVSGTQILRAIVQLRESKAPSVLKFLFRCVNPVFSVGDRSEVQSILSMITATSLQVYHGLPLYMLYVYKYDIYLYRLYWPMPTRK